VIVSKHGETLVVYWGLAKPTGRAEPGGGTRASVRWSLHPPAAPPRPYPAQSWARQRT
jgi:hypothetical protein